MQLSFFFVFKVETLLNNAFKIQVEAHIPVDIPCQRIQIVCALFQGSATDVHTQGIYAHIVCSNTNI